LEIWCEEGSRKTRQCNYVPSASGGVKKKGTTARCPVWFKKKGGVREIFYFFETARLKRCLRDALEAMRFEKKRKGKEEPITSKTLIHRPDKASGLADTLVERGPRNL